MLDHKYNAKYFLQSFSFLYSVIWKNMAYLLTAAKRKVLGETLQKWT